MPKVKSKSSKNKSGSLSLINFKSSKVRFIATILVIAIIGGGYFTYKSFAATLSLGGFTNCAEIRKPSDCRYVSDAAVGQSANKGASANQAVEYIINSKSEMIRLNGNNTVSLRPGQYKRICIKARPMSNMVMEIRNGMLANNGGHKSWSLASNNSYQNYCSDWSKNSSTQDLQPFGGEIFVTKISSPTTLRIANVTSEISDTPPAAPAPAK